jgi:hypothetical protein
MQTYTPAELLKTNFSFTDPNIDKVVADGKKDLAVASLKIGRRPARVLLQGYLTTSGINKSEMFGDQWSFGIQLNSKEDVDAIHQLLDRLADALPTWDADTEYTVKDVFKDEVLYLKAKTNQQQTAFNFTSNYKLHPKKPNPDITRFMPVEVSAEVGAYIILSKNTAGLFFTVGQVTFRQHEEDAVDAADVESQPDRPQATPAPPPAAAVPATVPAPTNTAQTRRARRG